MSFPYSSRMVPVWQKSVFSNKAHKEERKSKGKSNKEEEHEEEEEEQIITGTEEE